MKIGEVKYTVFGDKDMGRRDAFHVPAILVASDQGIPLMPGDPVVFTDVTYTRVRKCERDQTPQAIVDPFVTIIPAKYTSTLFWVLMMPGTTSNLTHHFDIEQPLPSLADLYDDDDVYDSCRGCFDDEPVDEEYDDDGCKGCYE